MSKTIELQLENLKAMRGPSTYRFSSDREKYFVDLVGLLDSLVNKINDHKEEIKDLKLELRHVKRRIA